MIQVTEKQKREIGEKFTKYEIARILGARALQIAMNAPILIKLEKEELENTILDPLKIAETEFYASVLPITVKRPLPKKSEEKAVKRHIKAEEKIEEKKKEEKPEEKVKEKPKEKEEEKIEEKKPELEKPEEGTLEEVEQSEIMELATPPDEREEETVAEEEAE